MHIWKRYTAIRRVLDMNRFLAFFTQPFKAVMTWLRRLQLKKTKKGIRCPACTDFLILAVDGELPKPIVLPKFCPSCGVGIHRRCPLCDAPFKKLDRFCSACGTGVYDTIHKPPMKQISDSAETTRFLKQLRRDAEDMAGLIREELLVVIRKNPIHQACIRFHNALESITDDTPNDEAARIFELGLADAKVLETGLEVTKESLDDFVNEVVSNQRKQLDKLFPDWPKFIRNDWIERPEATARGVAQRLMTQIELRYVDAWTIRQIYKHLVARFPRLKELMLTDRAGTTLSGIIQQLHGLLPSGFGVLSTLTAAGVLGVHAYEKWRVESDEGFRNSFKAALDEFIDNSAAFDASIESITKPIIDQFIFDFREQCDAVHDGLEKAAHKGLPVAAICRALHTPETPVTDADMKSIIESALNEMKAQGLSQRAESNLRHLCGLEDSPA